MKRTIVILTILVISCVSSYSNTITVYGRNIGTTITTQSTTENGVTTTTTTMDIKCDNFYTDKCYEISGVNIQMVKVFNGDYPDGHEVGSGTLISNSTNANGDHIVVLQN